MFGTDSARLEAQIAQSGDQLNVKLAQNSIQQNMAAVNASIKPWLAQQRDNADAIKLNEHLAAIDKLNADLNPPQPTVPITPRGTVAGAPPISQQARDDWNRPVIQIQVDVHNPVLTSQQSSDDAVAVFRRGLDQALASGTALPAWTGNY